MFRKLLVPLDGSGESAAVVPLAQTLAAATGAQITLVRVTPAWGDPSEHRQTDEPTDLAQIAASLRRVGLTAEATIRRVMRGDQVAMAIAGEARARRADLIMMVTHVRTGPGRVARESIADQVLRLSPVPVLLLGADGRYGELPDTILAPVDGTQAGNTALELAAGLARIIDAEVVVLRVVAPELTIARPTALDDAYEEIVPTGLGALADAQHQVDWLATRLRGWGIVAQGRAVLGRLPDTILETADLISAGLIVMSTCARRGLAWSAPDGVAISVARQAHQPTLLVRRESASLKGSGTRHAAIGAGVPA